MAKPRARPAAASARASPAPTSSDPNLPTPTSISIPRADHSSSGAKAAVASANRSSVGSSSSAAATELPAPAARDFATVAKEVGKRLAYDDVGSSSSAAATELPAPAARDFATVAKEVGKRLAYDDDDSTFPTAAATLQPELVPEGLADLAPLLELPDPDDASSTTVASAADATNASADSTVTQVAAPADSITAAADAEGPVLTEMEVVLAELHGARGLTPRSKRLLAALAETASAELDYNPTAAVIRTRRAAFWRKVRVGVLAATVFSVAAMDVALAVALFGARSGNNGRYGHVLPPT